MRVAPGSGGDGHGGQWGGTCLHRWTCDPVTWRGGWLEVSFPGNWGLDPARYGLSERTVMVPVLSTLSAKHVDLHVAWGPLVAKT